MFGRSERDDGKTRVKICGITNAPDAVVAIECGADALGWNFFRGSKRFIPPERATAIIRELPKPVAHVAILVNPTFDEALALGDSGTFTALQLHGTETPTFCARLSARGVRFAKAIPVTADGAVEPIAAFATDIIVLDSIVQDQFGGTGVAVPWQVARELRDREGAIRIVLAGGLTPENVCEAIRVVRPFGVDVTTAVEAAPGRKEHARLRAFFAAVQSAQRLA
ncbi:MAG: phosphoribosylanthranilate isomerase [Chthoniobacterales bacterium]